MDAQIKNLTNASLAKDTESVRNILNDVVEEVNLTRTKPVDFMEAMEAEDSSKIITTGIEGLDQFVVGCAGLTIVSASSGAGKTAFMLEMAIGQYLSGLSVLFVSLEISAQVLGKRLKANLTGIPFSKIIQDNLTDTERDHITDTMRNFFDRENSFRVVTTPLDSDELLNLIQVEKSLYDIDVVHLDYLNLVSAPRGSVGGWQALSDIARALHRMSMSIGVVTVSASQTDLEKKPKGGAYPEIRTRGSAELLFSSTLLIYLYRPDYDDEVSSDKAVVLYCMKNRNAQQCQLLLEADFSHMKFKFLTEI
jgi:replicative DNA helicase